MGRSAFRKRKRGGRKNPDEQQRTGSLRRFSLLMLDGGDPGHGNHNKGCRSTQG